MKKGLHTHPMKPDSRGAGTIFKVYSRQSKIQNLKSKMGS